MFWAYLSIPLVLDLSDLVIEVLLIVDHLLLEPIHFVLQLRGLSVVDLAQVGAFNHHLGELQPISEVLASRSLEELIRSIEF